MKANTASASPDKGNYTFPALISRPVTFEGDPDCQDTYGVPVIVQCDVCRGATVGFLDSEVSGDVRADDGTIAYHRGETIRQQSYTAHNIAELNAAYLKNRRWDAPDNVQEFPSYDRDEVLVEDYDQRMRRRVA